LIEMASESVDQLVFFIQAASGEISGPLCASSERTMLIRVAFLA